MPYTGTDQWWPDSYTLGPPWSCRIDTGQRDDYGSPVYRTVTVDQHGIGDDGTDYSGETLSCTIGRDDYGMPTRASIAFPTDPEPAPEPEPDEGEDIPAGDRDEPGEPGAAVAAFLGHPDDETLVAMAGQHTPIVAAMAAAYTRGEGFTDQGPADDLAAVVTTATARLLANPEQLAYDVGGTGFRNGFTGWSLAELAVLNRYRRRTA